MCASYKEMPTVETMDYQDQFIFIDDFDDFPIDESNYSFLNYFDEIRFYCNKIDNIIQYDNVENHKLNLLFYLKHLEEIFKNEISENIDDFLTETNIVGILYNLLHYKYRKSIGTGNSIYILNILAHIAKISPHHLEEILTLITKNSKFILDDNSSTDDVETSLLFELLRSPNLSPRIVTIFLFVVDESPYIIENLVLNTNMISRLAYITSKLKCWGHNYPQFIVPLTTLISVLFSFISFDVTYTQDEEGNNIVEYNYIKINLEGKQISFPIEKREYSSILKIQEELLSLIYLIPDEDNVENLHPLLDILAKYLDCFAIKDTLLTIINPDVEQTLNSFFMEPRKFDEKGQVFSQVLTIYDKILRIDPSFFKDNLIDKLFEHIGLYEEDRIDILFFLSNLVKFEQLTNYILENNLMTQVFNVDEKVYCFIDLLSDMTYNEKENALITILTIIYYEPEKTFAEILEQNFLNVIYDSIDNCYSGTNSYFLRMFLCTLQVLLKNYQNLLENIDSDSVLECLTNLSEDSIDIGINQFAQALKDEYFSE